MADPSTLDIDLRPLEEDLASASADLRAVDQQGTRDKTARTPAASTETKQTRDLAGAGSQEAEKATRDTEKLTASLKEQTQTVGLTGHQLEIFKLQQAGASAEQIKAANVAEKDLRSAQRGQAFKQAVFSGQGAAAMAGIGGGLAQQGFSSAISRSMGGSAPRDATQDALGQVGQFAQLLPGPLGSIVSTVTGVLGGFFQWMNAESNKMRERVGNAMAGVISGSTNARDALAGVRIGALTEDFTRLADRATLAIGRGELLANMGIRPNDVNQGIGEEIDAIVRRAERTQQLMAQVQNNPQMQRINRQMAGERADLAASQQTEGIRNQSQTAGVRTNELLQGRSGQEASDAAQRFQMQLELAGRIEQTGVGRAQAMAQAAELLAPRLQQMAEAQQQNRGAQASVQVAESVRAGGEELEMIGRRTAMLRDQRLFVGDVTQEEQQLAVLRRQGASEDVIQRRTQQIDQLRAGRVQQEMAGQGRALVEQTRNPLEAFDRERERLDTLLQAGAIDADVHARGMQNALGAVERAAGEAPAGQAALQEGSAAAASAILRAQRQMEREDPTARLQRAFSELREVAGQQRGLQRELVDLVRRGDIFRAVNL